MMKFAYFVLCLLLLASCGRQKKSAEPHEARAGKQEFPTTGNIDVLDSALLGLILPDAKVEVLVNGLDWAEGPLWLAEQQVLLFSDVPANKVYQWSEQPGSRLYLSPSGYTGGSERAGEVGSNGLLLDEAGRLVLCQHGDRRIARMDAPLDNPEAKFTTLASRYKGQRLNSPNDAVYHSNGDLYFTDPAYGLEKKMADPAKEIDFQGVYRLTRSGEVELLTNALSRPNGIAFSPDEKTLYVANSDAKKPVWMAYNVLKNGRITKGRIFFDASHLVEMNKGLPDGLKVARDGILFASGPGGILIISSKGKHLGTIRTGQATSNCALNEDESFLYITADMYLMRIPLK